MPYLPRKIVQAMVENLRKQAKVEILVPLTDDVKPAAVAEKPAAVAEKPAAVAEQVIVEEVKDKDGKVIAEEAVIKEEVLDQKPATEAPAAATPEVKK